MSEEWIALRAQSGQSIARGSPAHAGMDRGTRSGGPLVHRLPRPRGDGPEARSDPRLKARAPPPTRGWTASPVARARWSSGSPAHAGMDPRCGRTRRRKEGLPRPRGDGPVLLVWPPDDTPAPPPTRGWTAATPPTAPAVPGSPAHAGMDRPFTEASDGEERLPRPRGDGPAAHSDFEHVLLAPPPTRGWTSLVRAARIRGGGSPAHAGMDLEPSGLAEDVQWLPRPRGDGPRCARFGEIDDRKPGFVPSRSIPVTGSQSAKILQVADMADAVQPHQGNSPYSTLRMISRIRRRPSNVSQRSMGRPLPKAGRAVPSQS